MKTVPCPFVLGAGRRSRLDEGPGLSATRGFYATYNAPTRSQMHEAAGALSLRRNARTGDVVINGDINPVLLSSLVLCEAYHFYFVHHSAK